MDSVEAIRIRALLDVIESQDFLYHYRRVCRWYSKTFFTPLHEVEELPMDYVLQQFFETQFEDMKAPERKKLAIELTETEKEKKKRIKEEKRKSDEAFLKKIAKKAKQDEVEALEKLQKEAASAAKKIAELSEKEMLGPTKPPLPDISMAFENGNLSEEEESIPLPPRKR